MDEHKSVSILIQFLYRYMHIYKFEYFGKFVLLNIYYVPDGLFIAIFPGLHKNITVPVISLKFTLL